jgi:hypothetical protein
MNYEFVHESTDTAYLNLFLNNPSQTKDAPLLCSMNRMCNSILPDLSEWNLYINSVLITASEIAYRNFRDSISWDMSNYSTNKTNLSISIYDSSGAYSFDLTSNTNLLVSGIEEDPGNAGHYKGVCVFVQYLSENVDLTRYPNPLPSGTGPNSSAYPDYYFNLHNLQQFMDMITSSFSSGLSHYTTPITNNFLYFSYNTSSGLYGLTISDDVKATGLKFYVNSFLSRFIDGFRFQSIKKSDLINGPNPYNGMDCQLILSNNSLLYKSTVNSVDVWNYSAEYPTVQNLVDIQSLVITCGGSLSGVRPQVFQDLGTLDTKSTTLTTKPILKILDFIIDSNNASINDTVIQFEAITLDKPINVLTNSELMNLVFDFYIMNLSGKLIPLYVSSSGLCTIKLCLKRKK